LLLFDWFIFDYAEPILLAEKDLCRFESGSLLLEMEGSNVMGWLTVWWLVLSSFLILCWFIKS
jgi:hypothetical protein